MTPDMHAADLHERRVLARFARCRAAVRHGAWGFAEALDLIAGATGLDRDKARAALAGGFSSPGTRARLAAWNGLTRATRHGVPVLRPDCELQASALQAPARAADPCPREAGARGGLLPRALPSRPLPARADPAELVRRLAGRGVA